MRKGKNSLLRWLEHKAGSLMRSALEIVRERTAERQAQDTPASAVPRGSRTTVAEPQSEALTEGIRVRVQSLYLPDQSEPEDERYVFAYTVAISNEGIEPAELRTRHWVITDGRGGIEEVDGDGVVGEQPRLGPGESFQYTSGCVLKTPLGTMHGSYQMYRDDGRVFDASIAPFVLASPHLDPNRTVN